MYSAPILDDILDYNKILYASCNSLNQLLMEIFEIPALNICVGTYNSIACSISTNLCDILCFGGHFGGHLGFSRSEWSNHVAPRLKSFVGTSMCIMGNLVLCSNR